MSDATLTEYVTTGYPTDERCEPVRAVLDALQPLTVSSDPTEVFASAVRLCAPRLCDSAMVEVMKSDQASPEWICWPPTGVDATVDPAVESDEARDLQFTEERPTSEHTVYTPIQASDGQAELGTLALCFDGRRPGPAEALVGQLVAERISSTIGREQLRELLAQEKSRADNLQQALVHSRSIGAALGILMALNKCTNDQAFALLRRASQESHRKLYEIALDVIDTGTLD